MQICRNLALVSALALLMAGCGGENHLDGTAATICDAIDDEVSDELALEGFELAIARERREGTVEQDLRAAVEQRCGRALEVIQTSAEHQEPTPGADAVVEEVEEPEPMEVPEVVNLATLDWFEQSWTTDCTNEDDAQQVTLTYEEEFGGVRRPGDGALTPIYVVGLNDAVHGDVTGDGHDDAVFVTQCVFASAEYFVEVWSHDEAGQPLHLPPVHHFSKFTEAVEKVEVGDEALRIHSGEGAPGDDMPHLNGYPVKVVTDWSFDGQQWHATEISRSELTTEPQGDGASPSPDGGGGDDGFRSPTGNIYCEYIGGPDAIDEVGCVIRSGLVPSPGDLCRDSDSNVVALWLGSTGSAVADCDEHGWIYHDNPVLDYGATWSRSGITCTSQETGVTCRNEAGGELKLARASWHVS